MGSGQRPTRLHGLLHLLHRLPSERYALMTTPPSSAPFAPMSFSTAGAERFRVRPFSALSTWYRPSSATPHLSAADKVRAVWGLLKAKLTDQAQNAQSLDSQTFYDWLKRNRQSERAIPNLWNLIILPTLNDDARDVSADMALMVIQDGLLKTPRDAAIGYARVGLGSIADLHARRFIEDNGGKVMRGKDRPLALDGRRQGLRGATLRRNHPLRPTPISARSPSTRFSILCPLNVYRIPSSS